MDDKQALMWATKFQDGLKDVLSDLPNRRNVVARNVLTATARQPSELAAIYRTGIGSKIVRLKTGYALNDTLQFESVEDEKFYRQRCERAVKAAARWMFVFGRGIIVLQERGVALDTVLRSDVGPERLTLRVFSGDMVTVPAVSIDLNDPDYFKPKAYQVRAATIHPSRVVDFRYVEPREEEAAQYQYGGISEFELIYDQIVADGVVQRASPAILEKNSTLFYKAKGFKEAMMVGQEDHMIRYFRLLEEGRSIYGAGLLDADDDVAEVSQALSNLGDADQITLRRLAMVTGIPLSILIGENVRGLNSTGEGERQSFQDMIEALQFDHLLEPTNTLMGRLGRGSVEFRENQLESAKARIDFETAVVTNAEKLWQMGEDYEGYLLRHDVTQKSDFNKVFPDALES